MRSRGRPAIALWLAFILVCGIIISRSQFTTDLSAFLPRSPTLSNNCSWSKYVTGWLHA